MTPIIISFDCIDYDPIESWKFPDPKRVDIWVNFTIGLDQSGGNNFLLHVLTTELVENNTSLASSIVLDCYSWDAVMIKVNEILAHSSRENWDTICEKLSQKMAWEYENYQPYNPQV